VRVNIEVKGPWRVSPGSRLGGRCGDKLVDDLRKLTGAVDSEVGVECFSLVVIFGKSHQLFGPWLDSFLAGEASVK
jgi:hypothetical protein